MIDFIAGIFLKLGHVAFIMPFAILLLIFSKTEIYVKAICFLLFSVIWNALLKQIFQVPLMPHLGDGYAFPSGHMHAACLFYGYVLYRMDDKRIKASLLILILCLGWSLHYHNFHDVFDISGAIVFTLCEISLYHVLTQKFGIKPLTVLACTIIPILVVIACFYVVESHVYHASYALLAIVPTLCQMKNNQLKLLNYKVIACLGAFPLVFLVDFVFKKASFANPMLSGIKLALTPIVVYLAIKLAARLEKEKKCCFVSSSC